MAAGLAASVLSAGAQDVRQAREMRARGPLPRTAYQGRSRPEQTERFSRRIKIGGDGRVSVANFAGDIVVTGGPGDEVSIEAIKRTHGDPSQLASVHIEVDEHAGRVDVRTMYGARHDSVSVDYTIAVPSSASIGVKSVSGNVKVARVQGSVRAETVEGSVTASATPRLEIAKAVSGDVDLSDAGADGDLTAASVSGNVRVKGLKGHSLNLGTVSGDLTLSNVACDRLVARSVSGNVEYSGALTKNGRYDVTSHSGTVRLTLDGATGFEFNAISFSGSIRSELPLTMAGSSDSTQRDDRRGPGPRRRGRVLNSPSMRANFGDGSATLTIRTFSGDIVIARGK